MTQIARRALSDGNDLPAIGYGTYPLSGVKGAESISSAIGVGYRLIDTAVGYLNEDVIGQGIRKAGVARDELVITTKLPDQHHGRAETIDSLQGSLWRLGLEFVDLYLIHWPRPDLNLFAASWLSMVELKEAGLAKSIGVSNFEAEHLDRIWDESGVMPVVNQIPVNPYAPATAARTMNADRGVITESYTPLGPAGRAATDPVLNTIAMAHDVTVNQVVLRWHVQLGAVPIPKSQSAEHQRENFDVFGFELSENDMEKIASLSEE